MKAEIRLLEIRKGRNGVVGLLSSLERVGLILIGSQKLGFLVLICFFREGLGVVSALEEE